MYRRAFRLSGNRQDAEDLTQETFIRVFRSLARYTPTGAFEGWLHRITANLFLDLVRRRQRIRFHALPDDTPKRLARPRSRAGPAVRRRPASGPRHPGRAQRPAPDFRAAVVLCDIEGLSYEEIAATLGVKLGTVRSRIHRGRAQLRTALDHRRPRRPGIRRQGCDPGGRDAAAVAPKVKVCISLPAKKAVETAAEEKKKKKKKTAAVPLAGDL